MSRRILSTLTLLGVVAALFVWKTNREPSGAAANTAAPPIPPRWQPLFATPPDRGEAIALARQMDASFDLRWLAPWVATVPAARSGHRDDELLFLVFNEVVERHRLAEIDPPALAAVLSGTLTDAALHPVLRDYAAQHLALVAERAPALRADIVATFCSVLENPADFRFTIPGTVVNALGELSDHVAPAPFPHRRRLATALSRLIRSPEASLPLRVTLLQSASVESADLYLPVLRATLADPDAPGALSLAAVGAIGRIGTREDLPLLAAVRERGTHASLAVGSAIESLSQLR